LLKREVQFRTGEFDFLKVRWKEGLSGGSEEDKAASKEGRKAGRKEGRKEGRKDGSKENGKTRRKVKRKVGGRKEGEGRKMKE